MKDDQLRRLELIFWLIDSEDGLHTNRCDHISSFCVTDTPLSNSSPDIRDEYKAVATAARAWNVVRLVQVGASAPATAINRKQTDNSSMLLIWSNSGPIMSTPTTLATPAQMNIADICAVLDDVRTSISGRVVTIVPTLTPCENHHLSFSLSLLIT